MKKSIFFILMIISFSLPISVFGTDTITKEYLNQKLLEIDNSFIINSNEKVEDKILENINTIITEEDIIKDLKCDSNNCILILKHNDLSSEEKVINYSINAESTNKEEHKDISATVNYQSHIQNIGWQNYVSNGIAGTTNKNLRLEGIRINISTMLEGKIEYSTHVQNIGWQSYVSNNDISGTTGRSLRLEAIKIRLTGELANYYDIYYRIYMEDYGWLSWAKNDAPAGSEGLGKRTEAIEVKLVEKTSSETFDDTTPFIKKNAFITYQSHVQNIGNQKLVSEGSTSGTTGRKLRMEAININLDTQLNGNVIYQTYIERTGWESEYTQNGYFSGTTGKSKSIQLIKIDLTDELSKSYDIYYRVHSENYGWLGWAKNGEIAGVKSHRIEAIQIKLYFKFDSNKNKLSTKNHYIESVNYRPFYYSQKDKRWANKFYGKYRMADTGCTPTSLAMAFSGILSKTILPTDVANYLYNNTNLFNKRLPGSSGMGIVKAAEYYGVKRTTLKSKNDIINALQNGKIIYAAVGKGRFVKYSGTHAIIFYGYKGGNAIVHDPYDSRKNGYTSIDLLWKEQSKDPDDLTGGSAFYSLERY